MKYLFYKFFPNKEGRQALQELIKTLRNGGINFNIKSVRGEEGVYLVAESTNVPGKHIITSGTSLAELDENIKDAIFTAFRVPRYYCDEKIIKSPLFKEEIKLQYAAT